jgi:hypothetical protein
MIKMRAINYKIIFLYILGVILMYPVLTHILMYQLGYMKDKFAQAEFWGYIQILFSGPGLLILGFILWLKYGGLTNKILAFFFIIISLYWMYKLVSDILREAA